MGPEPGLAFQEDAGRWEQRVESFREDIARGYIPPPLIVTDFWQGIHISDGAHRYEALLRNNLSSYWTVFFLKSNENVGRVLAAVS